jgi:hypothetical protein
MRIRLAIPDQYVSAPVLDAALEATTRAAQSQMLAGDAPTFTDLMRSGVKWRPEPFSDGEHFDLPAVIGERGWADCDDLAPALAAELRARGQDPGARARVVRSGRDRWHAIVQLSDGTIVDPSKIAGMKSNQGVRGAIARPMARIGESAIALAPRDGEWWARTDVPWGKGHLSSLARERHAVQALDRSVVGALACGAVVDWPHAVDRTLLGRLYEEVAGGELGASWTRYPNGPSVVRF